MIQIVLHRNFSLVIACSDGMQWVRGGTSHGWQDKAGFPATGPLVLRVCLHIFFGRLRMWHREKQAALFPIVICFQPSESRRPRRSVNWRWPYVRWGKGFYAVILGLQFYPCAMPFDLQSSFHGARRRRFSHPSRQGP
jgi:hypothetical protein